MIRQRVLGLVGLLVLALSFCLAVPSVNADDPISTTIQTLYNDLLSQQVTEDQDFGWFSWAKQKGLWPSYIHINFVGDELMALLRDMRVWDANMFVTAWTIDVLLESVQQGIISPIPQANLSSACEALQSYHDQNYPDGVPSYVFWPQIERPAGSGVYVCWPPNMEDILALTGVTVDDDESQLRAFFIPSDFDDIGVNLAYGEALWQQRDNPEYEGLWTAWNASNYDLPALVGLFGQYTYQPFSSNPSSNSIDPRTYYWIHPFLELLQSEANSTKTWWKLEDVQLVTTWVLDLKANAQTYPHDYAMPFNVNNVDANVCANALQGLVRAALRDLGAAFGPGGWFLDRQLQNLAFFTSRLLQWVIQHNVLNFRPDLTLLYYMGSYNFYWFTSRTVEALEGYALQAQANPALPPLPGIFQEIRRDLRAALQSNGTATLLANSTQEGRWTYWDNFLGDADTIDGKPVKKGEDRICSTAVSLLALLNTWSLPVLATNSTATAGAAVGSTGQVYCGRKWLANTPESVLLAANQSAEWLNKYSAGDRYKKENAFFSGSVKANDLPFFYPSNFAGYLNGTQLPAGSWNQPIPNSEVNDQMVVGMSGVVSATEYSQMLQQTWFGVPVPTEWLGYNESANGTLVYWSAPALTYATSISALGKWQQTCMP